jgi:hypothetical protein
VAGFYEQSNKSSGSLYDEKFFDRLLKECSREICQLGPNMRNNHIRLQWMLLSQSALTLWSYYPRFRRLVLFPSSGIVVCRVRKLLFVSYYGVKTAHRCDTYQTLMMDLKTVSEKAGYSFHIDISDQPRIFQSIQLP